MEFDVTERSPIHGSRIIWTALAVLFFFLYSWLPRHSPAEIFNSPDEMANHFFAANFAENNNLAVFEPLEEVANNLIHPRAVTVRDNYLIPASFTGLPVIYGMLAKFFGIQNIIFFTAIFSVLAILAWRRIIGQVFGSAAGNLSAIILGITPAWIYYANRGLYHNVLFVALLIFSAYFFICQPFLRRFLNFFISGLFLGLALWVRASEFFWVISACLILFFIFWKKIRFKKFLIFFAGTGLAFLPALILNYFLYGDPLKFGYTANNASSVAITLSLRGSEAAEAILDKIIYILFPFGVHLRTALANFFEYFIKLPIWSTVLLVISLIFLGFKFLRGRATREELILISLFFGISGWLALLYGSWVIHDNPNPDAITIGISYSRYWLPVFLLSSGIIGVVFGEIFRKWQFRPKILFTSVVFIILFLYSIRLVFAVPDDGLFAVNNTLHRYADIKEDVLRRTLPDVVIIVDRADKIFFPERRVVVGLRDDATYAILSSLALRAPIYYYGTQMTEDDLRFHNEEKLVTSGLRMEKITNYDNEALYRFVR